jgi:hypothetical protein
MLVPPDSKPQLPGGALSPTAPRHEVAFRMRQVLATEQGKARYALRQSTVEPVFGQIKEARGIRRFRLRGLLKTTSEWKLICATHNLLKLFRHRTTLVSRLTHLAGSIPSALRLLLSLPNRFFAQPNRPAQIQRSAAIMRQFLSDTLVSCHPIRARVVWWNPCRRRDDRKRRAQPRRCGKRQVGKELFAMKTVRTASVLRVHLQERCGGQELRIARKCSRRRHLVIRQQKPPAGLGHTGVECEGGHLTRVEFLSGLAEREHLGVGHVARFRCVQRRYASWVVQVAVKRATQRPCAVWANCGDMIPIHRHVCSLVAIGVLSPHYVQPTTYARK